MTFAAAATEGGGGGGAWVALFAQEIAAIVSATITESEATCPFVRMVQVIIRTSSANATPSNADE